MIRGLQLFDNSSAACILGKAQVQQCSKEKSCLQLWLFVLAAGLRFTTSAETQQRTPSSTSNHSNLDEAMKSVVEEGEEGDEGDEGEEGEDVEVECAQPSVEAMMSEILPVEGLLAASQER